MSSTVFYILGIIDFISALLMLVSIESIGLFGGVLGMIIGLQGVGWYMIAEMWEKVMD